MSCRRRSGDQARRAGSLSCLHQTRAGCAHAHWQTRGSRSRLLHTSIRRSRGRPAVARARWRSIRCSACATRRWRDKAAGRRVRCTGHVETGQHVRTGRVRPAHGRGQSWCRAGQTVSSGAIPRGMTPGHPAGHADVFREGHKHSPQNNCKKCGTFMRPTPGYVRRMSILYSTRKCCLRAVRRSMSRRPARHDRHQRLAPVLSFSLHHRPAFPTCIRPSQKVR